MTSELTLDRLLTEDMALLVREIMNARKKKECLEKHKYKIYQGGDGRWFTRFPNKSGGSTQKAFRSKEEAEDAVASFYLNIEETPTVEEVFKAAVADRLEEGSISPPTKRRLEYDFIKYCSNVVEERINDVTAEMVENLLRTAKIDHNLDSKGYGHVLGIVRLIFKYAKRKKLSDILIEDVISSMDWGKNAFRKEERDDADEVFTDEEVEKLALYFKTNPTGKHLGLLLLFATGLRIGELAALRWEDIGESEIFVRRTETCYTNSEGRYVSEVINLPKTLAGKRLVPIPTQALWIIKALRELNPDGEWVFMVNGSRTRTVYFRKAMSKACDAVGIKRRSPHKIRKTYASILLDNNLSVKVITENMGHTDISVTNEHYARRRKKSSERQKMMSDILEFDVVAAVAEEK